MLFPSMANAVLNRRDVYFVERSTTVTLRLPCRPASGLVLAAASVCVAVAAFAQTPDAPIDWRRANDAVGEFRRGHADALKWEEANRRDAEKPAEAPATLSLTSADDAVRLAWKAHLDLGETLAVLPTELAGRVAAGRWSEIDLGWRRRAHDLDELLEVAAAARKAWLQAVAAGQVVKHRRDAVAAAESAAELAARMARVGNWSKLQEARVQTVLNGARMDLRRAEYAQAGAQAELLAALRLTGTHASVQLPDALPELPAAPASDAVLRQRLDAVAAELPRAERLRTAGGAAVAIAAHRAGHEIALRTHDDLTLQDFVVEETTLRYNGMLASVWDLLGEVRNRAQAAADAVDALRDFWIADVDLQHLLLGGVPERFISLGNGSKDAAAAAH